MTRLLLKALTVCLGYSLVGQILRQLYPFFPHPVMIIAALIFLATVSVACVQRNKIPDTEFYVLIFWTSVGLCVGVAT